MFRGMLLRSCLIEVLVVLLDGYYQIKTIGKYEMRLKIYGCFTKNTI